jgi:hypothetical protein
MLSGCVFHAVGDKIRLPIIIPCRPIVAMKLEGGQYGHHNHSDHHRHTVAYRRRLVRPRTVVLGSDFTYIDGMLWRSSRGSRYAL